MKATILVKNGLRMVDLNRRRAVREKCLNCSAWSTKEVQQCSFKDCPLYPYREGTGTQDPKARDKAIKAYCLWCMAGQRGEIARCVSVHCPLFAFRKDRREKSNPLPEKLHGEPRIEANSHI